jgi:hypothetical protein
MTDRRSRCACAGVEDNGAAKLTTNPSKQNAGDSAPNDTLGFFMRRLLMILCIKINGIILVTGCGVNGKSIPGRAETEIFPQTIEKTFS